MTKVVPATKWFIFFLFAFLFSGFQAVKGQVVTTIPAFPTENEEITLIFDLKQAKDSRAAGLLGKTNDVFLWSGAGTTETGDAFQYGPPGQTTWAAPYEPGRMTSLGNDRWQIRLTPRQYFSTVPSNTPIRRLGVLLKSGNGSAQTEDFFIKIYPAGLHTAFQQPSQKSFFVNANAAIPVKAIASRASELTLKLDNTTLHSVQNQEALEFTLNAGTLSGVRRSVVIEARTATETATETFFYTVKPQPTVAALPAGVKDGVNYISASKVVLVFFAPLKEFVYAIGEFNNWQVNPDYLMKRTADGNRYWIELDNLPLGQEVAYQYLVDGTMAVADPYTDKILDPVQDSYLTAANYPDLKTYPVGATGIVSVLQTNQPAYNWRVTDFQRPDPKNMVVYELLVRDFVATRNYKTLTDTLTYLKRLGVNAIELMPIMEFAGNDSWGYNPIFFFAPDKAYGTKNDLKAFIDKCHEFGIAVILDMVLNQADYEFPYVKMYWEGNRPAANNPFFNQEATHPFSVFFDFNHDSEATKALVQRVNQYWLEEYKFDGYRFDLSKGFTQRNYGNNVEAWSAYDASRVAIWKRIYNEIRSYDQTAYVILEHFADNQEEKELADYGMMFWGNHNHAYRDMAKGVNANPNWISYKQRGWQKPHVLGYMESHDEERLLYDVKMAGRSGGGYNTRIQTTALDRAKLAATFFLPVPGPKLIWQFGEMGYDVPIDQNGRTGVKPIRWEYLQDENRRKLFQVYAELIKLKLTQPAFQTDNFTLALSSQVKRITLNHPTMDVFIIGNFDVNPQTVPAGFPKAGVWYDYFSNTETDITDTTIESILQPGEFHIYTTVKLPSPEPNLVSWQGVVLSSALDKVFSKNLVIYPNPVGEASVLELSNSYRGAVNVQLIDMTGRMLKQVRFQKSQESQKFPIELRTLSSGIYYLQVEQGGLRGSRKLVKLK